MNLSNKLKYWLNNINKELVYENITNGEECDIIWNQLKWCQENGEILYDIIDESWRSQFNLWCMKNTESSWSPNVLQINKYKTNVIDNDTYDIDSDEDTITTRSYTEIHHQENLFRQLNEIETDVIYLWNTIIYPYFETKGYILNNIKKDDWIGLYGWILKSHPLFA